ncbi:FAD binding domain-containing protein [Ramlibacter sp.]|uniref:FAD binding domain-containing protein n=1 Tax=Ramlibacter sp. TaxID=1917967 RepID=UPI002C65B07D|nr:FAD binding domain-containing protein [Ramlibacter sp.]HWI82499.1 FAD binding domain-containing protein [Ramlibacter sp.]
MLTFDRYLTPATLEDAFDAIERIPGARIVAGATDLLPWARQGRAGDVHLPALVDVTRVPQLQGISAAAGRIRLGAATPIAAFQNDALLQRQAPVLGCCAVWFADDQIREQATIGGNLVNASPAGDSQPALLAMNASVTLARREGGAVLERSLPLSEFILGPSRTALQPQEILTAIEIDAVPGHGAAFEKVGHRRSLVISTVCLAALVKLDWAGRRIEDCRVAIGAVGPVPQRLADVEHALQGQAPSAELVREAAGRVADRVRSRSRQEYRREVLVNFVERALVAALGHAGVHLERLAKEEPAHV